MSVGLAEVSEKSPVGEGGGEHLFNNSSLQPPRWQYRALPCQLSKPPGPRVTEHGKQGQNTLTFIALAAFLGGTFSFCDRRRTEDLLTSSGGENRKSQVSVFLSPVTFSSLKICRLILEMQSLCQLEGCVARGTGMMRMDPGAAGCPCPAQVGHASGSMSSTRQSLSCFARL